MVIINDIDVFDIDQKWSEFNDKLRRAVNNNNNNKSLNIIFAWIQNGFENELKKSEVELLELLCRLIDGSDGIRCGPVSPDDDRQAKSKLSVVWVFKSDCKSGVDSCKRVGKPLFDIFRFNAAREVEVEVVAFEFKVEAEVDRDNSDDDNGDEFNAEVTESGNVMLDNVRAASKSVASIIITSSIISRSSVKEAKDSDSSVSEQSE